MAIALRRPSRVGSGAMFSLSTAVLPVPPSIEAMGEATWAGVAQPGSWWTGEERVAIATMARAARLGADARDTDGLPDRAVDAVRMLAATPAHTSRAWVDSIVDAIGETRYVEIVGIVSRIIATDTFTRMLGVEPIPFPAPEPGAPAQPPEPEKARKGKQWVRMAGFPVPPFVLSLVPPEQRATNTTEHALYMTGEQMESPDTTIDGLHRTQIETVATTVSHSNECFY